MEEVLVQLLSKVQDEVLVEVLLQLLFKVEQSCFSYFKATLIYFIYSFPQF